MDPLAGRAKLSGKLSADLCCAIGGADGLSVHCHLTKPAQRGSDPVGQHLHQTARVCATASAAGLAQLGERPGRRLLPTLLGR